MQVNWKVLVQLRFSTLSIGGSTAWPAPPGGELQPIRLQGLHSGLLPEMRDESAGSCSEHDSLKDWLRASVGMPGDCANVRPDLPRDHSAWLLGQHGERCLCQLLLRAQDITGVIIDSACTMLDTGRRLCQSRLMMPVMSRTFPFLSLVPVCLKL